MTQRNKDIKNMKMGEKKYKRQFDTDDQVCSLENSLIASEKGCKIPIKPTLFGPFRIWIYPKTFRSNKVRKATEIKTQISNKI